MLIPTIASFTAGVSATQAILRSKEERVKLMKQFTAKNPKAGKLKKSAAFVCATATAASRRTMKDARVIKDKSIQAIKDFKVKAEDILIDRAAEILANRMAAARA